MPPGINRQTSYAPIEFIHLIFIVLAKMAEPPKEGAIYRSYEEFETFLRDYCAATSQTFVVDNSRKVETANAKLPDEKRFPECLKYGYVKLTCVKYGDKKSRKSRPSTGARPNRR